MKRFELTVGGKDYKIDIEKFDGKQAVVKVDGKSYEIDVKKAAEAILPGRPTSPPASDTRGASPAAREAASRAAARGRANRANRRPQDRAGQAAPAPVG